MNLARKEASLPNSLVKSQRSRTLTTKAKSKIVKIVQAIILPALSKTFKEQTELRNKIAR